jgi:hypothetical protein
MKPLFQILIILGLFAIAVRLWLGPILVQEIHHHYGPEFTAKDDGVIEYRNTDLRESDKAPIKIKIPEVK